MSADAGVDLGIEQGRKVFQSVLAHLETVTVSLQDFNLVRYLLVQPDPTHFILENIQNKLQAVTVQVKLLLSEVGTPAFRQKTKHM